MPQSQSVAIQQNLWGISGIPHPTPLLKLEMLSDPHKIYRSRLTNVCYGSFMGSETWKHTSTFLRQFIWQNGDSPSADRNMRSVYSKIYLSVYLFVCLSVYHKGILPLASDLYNISHCLGLKHNFFRQRCPQVKTIHIGQHKENIWW